MGTPPPRPLLKRPSHHNLDIVYNQSTPGFFARLRCVDCGFWFGRYRCEGCRARLCGVCSDFPGPRLYSPGKGLCEACREQGDRESVKQFPLRSAVVAIGKRDSHVPLVQSPPLSDEFIAAMDMLAKAASGGKVSILATHQEIEPYEPNALSGPYYENGNPHWYRKTGETFRGADILEPVPEYEGMLHTGYEVK